MKLSSTILMMQFWIEFFLFSTCIHEPYKWIEGSLTTKILITPITYSFYYLDQKVSGNFIHKIQDTSLFFNCFLTNVQAMMLTFGGQMCQPYNNKKLKSGI